MSDDIVARLRDCTCVPHGEICREAADEIERLRNEAFHLAANQCHAGYGGEYGHHRCREIDRLTAERDEARRRICEDAVHMGDVYRRVNGLNVRLATGREVAEMMGWDCYREETADER